MKFHPAKLLAGTWTLGILAFMHLPVAVILLFSFSDRNILSMPIRTWTTKWYATAFHDPDLRVGLRNSVVVAVVASLFSVVLGTLGAMAVARYRFKGQSLFRAAVVTPILLPGIVSGVALLSFLSGVLHLPLGLKTVMVGHICFCIPVVFNAVAARLAQLPRSLEEAALDLGATPFQTFWKVTLPAIRSPLIAGALLAFTLSFDEIVVTFFLTTQEKTLPLVIYTGLRFGLSPKINAAVTMILAVSCVLVVISTWLNRKA